MLSCPVGARANQRRIRRRRTREGYGRTAGSCSSDAFQSLDRPQSAVDGDGQLRVVVRQSANLLTNSPVVSVNRQLSAMAHQQHADRFWKVVGEQFVCLLPFFDA